MELKVWFGCSRCILPLNESMSFAVDLVLEKVFRDSFDTRHEEFFQQSLSLFSITMKPQHPSVYVISFLDCVVSFSDDFPGLSGCAQPIQNTRYTRSTDELW